MIKCVIRGIFCFLFVSTSFVISGAKPNVVLILSDDQAWGDYGFMGHSEIATPNLDKLASESLLFKRGYVTAPLCRPSLASIASGLYLHQHGIVANDVSPHKREVREKEGRAQINAFNARLSLTSLLVDNGYLAFQSGKWWEGSFSEGHFTNGMTHGIAIKGGRHGDVGLSIGRKGIKPLTNFIDTAVAKEKPFFVWYAPFLPHTPHNPPNDLLKKYQKEGRQDDEAKYFAMCEWFDQTCGEVIGHLKNKSILQNTLIVYICDNGWVAKSSADISLPNNWSKGFAPRSKGSPYENGIRTPIMFSYPDKIKPQLSDDLAISIDLMPTILNVCGVKVPGYLPGIDLLNEKYRKNRNQIFGAAHAIHNMTVGKPQMTRQYDWVITPKWKYLRRHNGIDTTSYKTVHEWDTTPAHLYDLISDPGEKLNVISDHPMVAKALRAKLERWAQQ